MSDQQRGHQIFKNLEVHIVDATASGRQASGICLSCTALGETTSCVQSCWRSLLYWELMICRICQICLYEPCQFDGHTIDGDAVRLSVLSVHNCAPAEGKTFPSLVLASFGLRWQDLMKVAQKSCIHGLKISLTCTHFCSLQVPPSFEPGLLWPWVHPDVSTLLPIKMNSFF